MKKTGRADAGKQTEFRVSWWQMSEGGLVACYVSLRLL